MANNYQVDSASPRRKWVILAGILVLVIGLSAFLSLRPRRIRITVGKPQRQNITATISTNGKVEPTRNFEAHVPPGQFTVKRVHVKEGDRVRPGQLLVELDDAAVRQQATRALSQIRTAEANLAVLKAGGTQEELIGRTAEVTKTQADLDAAKRNLEGVKRLHERGAASDAELRAAEDRLKQASASFNALQQKSTGRYSSAERARVEAELADARAAYEAAQEILKTTNVRAPFAGTVYALPVRSGSFANGGDILVQVAELRDMQVRAFVDEPDIGRLQKGLPVRIAWDAIPGRIWKGTLISTPTTIVSRGSRMVGEILVQLNNEDRQLLPNVNVGVTVVLAQRPDALTVPREAIREEEGKKYLFVVRNAHLQRREITTGVANLTRIEVMEGLQPDDTVAIASLSPSPMTDGVSVKIVEQ